MIPDVLARRRLHSSNMSRINRSQANEYAITMKKIIDRRRKYILTESTETEPDGEGGVSAHAGTAIAIASMPV